MTPCSATLALALAVTAVHSQEPEPPRGTVQGRVVDALGEGLPATPVEAFLDGDTPVASTISDGDGMFVLAKLPTDRYVRVRARAEGRVAGQDYVRPSATRATEVAEIRLWDAGAVRVRVVDTDGAPIEGAHVSAGYDASRQFGFEPQSEAATGEEGTARLDGVPLGEIDVRAWKAGYVLAQTRVWLRGPPLDVELVLGEGAGVTLDVTIAGVPEGREASVRVLPYDKGHGLALPAPLRGGRAAQGRWTVSGLPALQYRVSAHLEGFTIAPSASALPVTETRHAVTFRATPTVAVRVQGVLRDTAGDPVAGETLLCRAFSSATGGTAVTDAEGRFDVECPVPVGERAILYPTDSALVVHQQKSDVDFGSWDMRFLRYHEFTVDPAAVVEVTAAPSAAVLGRVVDTDGRPVRGLRLELQGSMPNSTWMLCAFATTDRDGRYVFRGLNPPNTDLRVSPGQIGSGATEPFTLQLGATVDGLELVVPKSGSVAGVARGADGEPLPGARVWLRNYDVATRQQTDSSVFEVLADREGRFRHVDVEPGGHLLVLVSDQPRTGATSEIFEVAPGERVTMDLRATR